VFLLPIHLLHLPSHSMPFFWFRSSRLSPRVRRHCLKVSRLSPMIAFLKRSQLPEFRCLFRGTELYPWGRVTRFQVRTAFVAPSWRR